MENEFNPDSAKPAHEVIFSWEKSNINYPPITFNNVLVKRVQFHRHLGLTLGLKLDFHEHISSVSKVNKLTAVFRKLHTFTKAFSFNNLHSLYKTSHRLQ